MRIGEATNVQELVQAAETARTARLDARRGFETVWWNNIALVTGDHHARWNPVLATFEDHDPNWGGDLQNKKPRMVINHALAVARTELSKLTKSKPIMEVIANSDEQSDIAATKVGRAALDYAEWKFKMSKRRKQALWWMIQTGLGAIYVGWDPMDEASGTVSFVIDPATGEATFNPDRQQELKEMIRKGELSAGDVKEEKFALGELDFKVYSPFQLLPDENALDFDEIKDLITEDVVNVDIVRSLYGRAALDIQPDSDLAMGTIETRMLARAGMPGGLGGQQQNVSSSLRVHTLWLPPNVFRHSKFLKNGVMLRWAKGRTVLDFNPQFNYQDGRIPFAFFQHIPTSTTIWPDSVINHIRGPNLEIDKTVSQLIENKDYMANPMWLIPTQAKIKGQIRNVAGAMVRYRHVPNIPPPTPVAGLEMPRQVENLLQGLTQQILEISGQSEVARGQVPSGVRSGVAVAYLQEEDDTKIAPTVENMEEAVALLGSLTLERFSQFYTFERILRFYRLDGIFDVRKFKGADLKNNTDVICQAGSAMPRSKAARQQYALELASLGIETDPKKLKEMLEIGQGEPDDVDKAIAQANRENNMMLHGVWRTQTTSSVDDEDFTKLHAAIPVKTWHNHQVHIARHTSVMMDEEFDDLSIAHPEVVRLFDEHIAMHYQEIAAQQQQQQQALLAAKGAPDGPPTPAGGANGGFTPDTFMSKADVPDVIGKGVVSTQARQIRPQGG